VQRFAWLRVLDGVPQEPRYHAKGDVLIHTRLVVEALVSLDEWRSLPEQERSLLFAAASNTCVAQASMGSACAGGNPWFR
jgi:hypothetical protein